MLKFTNLNSTTIFSATVYNFLLNFARLKASDFGDKFDFVFIISDISLLYSAYYMSLYFTHKKKNIN